MEKGNTGKGRCGKEQSLVQKPIFLLRFLPMTLYIQEEVFMIYIKL